MQSDERPRDVIELGLLHQLEDAVRTMRAAQNRYFQSRIREHLIEAKAAERTVDARLRELQALRTIRA